MREQCAHSDNPHNINWNIEYYDHAVMCMVSVFPLLFFLPVPFLPIDDTPSPSLQPLHKQHFTYNNTRTFCCNCTGEHCGLISRQRKRHYHRVVRTCERRGFYWFPIRPKENECRTHQGAVWSVRCSMWRYVCASLYSNFSHTREALHDDTSMTIRSTRLFSILP